MSQQKKVHVIYCHPKQNSMTDKIKNAYVKGLKRKNTDYTISDLYADNFRSDMTDKEYVRESYDTGLPLEDDVLNEQRLLNDSSILTFIFPLFWMDAPSKLVGYFSRVFTRGFRYENDDKKTTMRIFDEVNFLIVTGSSFNDLKRDGKIEALKTTFAKDRINDKAKRINMYFFSETSYNKKERHLNEEKYLKNAEKIGYST